MTEIARTRLIHQRIAQSALMSPGEVVSHMGAIQAQDYAGAKWAVGLRLPGSTDAGIERALADRDIVRTWAIRGTLHFVAAKDVRWLLALVAPVIIRKNARRYRELGLAERTLTQSCEVLLEALQGGRLLDRRSLRKILEEKGIDTEGQRFAYMLQRASLEGRICQVGMRKNSPLFAALGEHVPNDEPMTRDDALAELAKRYFSSHGPATLGDFTWWSGLPAADARTGLGTAGPELMRENIHGRDYWSGSVPVIRSGPTEVNLLPVFDEYIVGYKDRSAILDTLRERGLVPKAGMSGPIVPVTGRVEGNRERTVDQDETTILASPFAPFTPTILINGQVAGTWKRTIDRGEVIIASSPFIPCTHTQKEAYAAAAQRYGEFLDMPVTWG